MADGIRWLTTLEAADHAQRRDVVHRFEAALRVLDESCRVYQHLCKRRIEPPVRRAAAGALSRTRFGGTSNT